MMWCASIEKGSYANMFGIWVILNGGTIDGSSGRTVSLDRSNAAWSSTRGRRKVEGVLQAWSEDFSSRRQLAMSSSSWCIEEDIAISTDNELVTSRATRRWEYTTYFAVLPVTMVRRGRVMFSFAVRPVVAGAVLGVNEVKLVEGVPRVVASSEV